MKTSKEVTLAVIQELDHTRAVLGSVCLSGLHPIIVVAVWNRARNTWRAYINLCSAEKEVVDQAMAANWGAKLNESEGRGFFPHLADLPYQDDNRQMAIVTSITYRYAEIENYDG